MGADCGAGWEVGVDEAAGVSVRAGKAGCVVEVAEGEATTGAVAVSVGAAEAAWVEITEELGMT